MDKFWFCYVEGSRVPFIKHLRTLESAQVEAERLATLNNVKGLKVFVLEAIGYAQVEYLPVIYHEIK